MTEASYYWQASVTGDATLAPYSDTRFHQNWHLLFVGADNQGPLRGVLNDLLVTSVSGAALVDTGAALVEGGVYSSDTSVSIPIPTPASDERKDRIVLRRDWSTQTIRIFRIVGIVSGAPSPPALTQISGTVWDTPIAIAHILADGTITTTDEREFAATPLTVFPRYKLIETIVPSGGAETIEFLELSQTFTNLIMIGQAASIVTGSNPIFFNDDENSANYQSSQINAFGAVADASSNIFGLLAQLTFRDSVAFSENFMTQFKMTLSGYSRSDILKTCIIDESVIHQDTDTSRYEVSQKAYVWEDASPISKIAILLNGATLFESRVSLYGF